MKWVRVLFYLLVDLCIRPKHECAIPQTFHQRTKSTLEWIIENDKINTAWNRCRKE